MVTDETRLDRGWAQICGRDLASEDGRNLMSVGDVLQIKRTYASHTNC